MKTKTFIVIVLMLLLYTPKVQADLFWDVYSDAVIQEGDEYIGVNVYDTPPNRTTVSMFGGYADYIHTRDSSILNVLGGRVQVVAFDQSVINITGGDFSGAEAWDYAVVNFSGDAVSKRLGAKGFGIVNILGGTVSNIGGYDTGTINIYAGSITDYIFSVDSSTINIFGHDLIKTASNGIHGFGKVEGYLTDDTYISLDLVNPEAYSNINLIPEPATIFLLAVGLKYYLYEKSRGAMRYNI